VITEDRTVTGTQNRRSVAWLAVPLLLALASGQASGADGPAEDWPQFRGPERDGRSDETGLLLPWPADGPKRLWRVELGSGYSGISVYKGRLYTMFGRDGDELAVALDARNGETIWSFRTDANRGDSQGAGPRSTPTLDEGIVYVLGAQGRLHALNAGDGKPVWSHDLRGEYGARIPQWGVATSPLVEGNLLLVDAGATGKGSILAFDKRTGKLVWRAFDDAAGYSAPIAVEVGGVRQVLFFTARHLVSIAPGDGTVLWSLPWKTSYDVNAATPVFIPPDRFFVSSGYDVGGAVYRIRVDGEKITVSRVWANREMKNQFSSSILVGGDLYGFDDKNLKCVDAASGQTRWRERGLGHGSLTYADGHLIVLGERGELVLVEATPEAYRERGRTRVFEGKTWTVPTLANGVLYLRDEKELVALDVSG